MAEIKLIDFFLCLLGRWTQWQHLIPANDILPLFSIQTRILSLTSRLRIFWICYWLQLPASVWRMCQISSYYPKSGSFLCL